MKLSRAHMLYVQSKYIADAGAVFLAFLLASYLFRTEIAGVNSAQLFFGTLIIALAWFIASLFSNLYVDRRTKKFAEEIIVSFYNAVLTVLISSSAFFFLFTERKIPNPYWMADFMLLFLFSILFKYLIRKYTHYLIYKGELTENFLLVGYTRSGSEFIDMVNQFRYYGYSCKGIINEEAVQHSEIPYLGKVSDLEQILKVQPIQEIILALSNEEAGLVKKIIQICDGHNRKVRLIPDLEKYTQTNIEVANLGIMPVLNYKKLPLDRWENRLIKRGFDVGFSVFYFLFIGSWLMPLIALGVKLTSRGPVFFKQERWGISNEKIVCYKFRTMNISSKDLDEKGNYNQATLQDPRITAFGRYLRKTSLDELPQFWNVLIGNMSVIGPRPHPVPLNMASLETVENYMLRHIIKPGISGWAQVNGCRGETRNVADMQKRVDHDLYYIHRWNLFFDIQIVLQTIINVFRGDQNAY